MIARSIFPAILHSISVRPVVLITGARQVGKTTLCMKLRDEHGFNYVSLRDNDERKLAKNNPDMFLRIHKWPLIIDEVQYAPELFESIEAAVDREKVDNGDNKGMYVLTGSQAYKLMDGVTDSLAGRISLIRMSPLSMSEIVGRDEPPFEIDYERNAERSAQYRLEPLDLYDRIVKGSYPEPTVNKDLTSDEFYSDYIDSYIDRDVSEIINVRNKDSFHSFMQLLASLTGQELNMEKISSAVGVDGKTVKSWISVLVAGDIIHLLQPYYDASVTKRVVKRPKIYFWDTGLACHLARVTDAESLMAGYLKGPMVETFIVNEILKTYRNNKVTSPFYYYRDSGGNEVDLVSVKNGRMQLIECKAGSEFGWNDYKMLSKGVSSQYPVGGRCIICPASKPYPIDKDIMVLPLTSI